MGDKEKFINFLEFIEELIAIETIQYYNKTGFFKFVLTKILELGSTEDLELFLDYLSTSDQRREFFDDHLKENSDFLLDACYYGKCDMVKIFYKHKCYLKVTEHEKKVNWKKDLNPFGFEAEPVDNKNLNILKMMATKFYIFGCFQAMLETKGIQDCTCQCISVITKPFEKVEIKVKMVIESPDLLQ